MYMYLKWPPHFCVIWAQWPLKGPPAISELFWQVVNGERTGTCVPTCVVCVAYQNLTAAHVWIKTFANFLNYRKSGAFLSARRDSHAVSSTPPITCKVQGNVTYKYRMCTEMIHVAKHMALGDVCKLKMCQRVMLYHELMCVHTL